MSYPYPQDRHRDRKEKGEQPYKDAKESMTQSDAQLQTEAEAYGEARRDESEAEREDRIAAELAERLREVNSEMSAERHDHS
jgi:hypothetical protein